MACLKVLKLNNQTANKRFVIWRMISPKTIVYLNNFKAAVGAVTSNVDKYFISAGD